MKYDIILCMNRKEQINTWKKANPENVKKHWRDWYKRLRLSVLNKVGKNKLECSRCKSNDYSWLEVNHINGGGRQEYKIKSGVGLYRAIVKGDRKTSDLEILCRPCNLVDAAERMSGKKYVIEL